MVDIRRVNSERLPKSVGSPRAEVGEIDTRAPFQSVKAAVSLFGEVAVSTRERRTPRKSRLSAENVIDKETQLLLAQKEINNVKQKLESAESTKAKADGDLETAKITLQDLATKLEALTQSKESAIEAREAVKEQARQLELQTSENHQDFKERTMELDCATEQYMDVATQLDAAKQELNKIRQDFDAALEVKLAAFQQAAEAHRSAKHHSERATDLSKEIVAMKEAIQQLKFATQHVYQEQANILAEKDALQNSYKTAKEEAHHKLLSLRKAYDPDLTKYLEEKLIETTAEVEALQEAMKKAHALEMDSRLQMEAANAKIAQEVKQKLELALEQAQDAKAAEKRVLNQMQDFSANLEPTGRIKISKEECESLKSKVGEFQNMADMKIAAAMTELEAINASNNETDKKLEATLKALEEIKVATELADKSTATAEAAQSVLESELRRRRQQEEITEFEF
ncbi:hypothetical protein COLO4_31944 [Corchorus olitorius]|uniref:WEB family protein n=1 Tax=Corchorus olitorius TaxID=93759 RepID=A0A1R3H342_9ROSI|nr:hypothetical protein COLO4_31944 [Corchorus olitorius]